MSIDLTFKIQPAANGRDYEGYLYDDWMLPYTTDLSPVLFPERDVNNSRAYHMFYPRNIENEADLIDYVYESALKYNKDVASALENGYGLSIELGPIHISFTCEGITEWLYRRKLPMGSRFVPEAWEEYRRTLVPNISGRLSAETLLVEF